MEIRRYPEVSFWTGRIIGSLQIHIWYLWGIICRQEKCSVIWINIVMRHFFRKNTTGKNLSAGPGAIPGNSCVLTVDAYDKYIYRTQWDNVSERQELLKRIYEQAQYTRGEELTTEDQMVALSTCSTSGTNARHVLILQDCAQQCFGGRKWKSICGDGK